MKKVIDIHSIRFKITLFIVSGIFIIFNLFIFYSTERYKAFAKNNAQKQSLVEIERYVFEIRNMVENHLGEVNSFSRTLSSVKSPQNPIELNREQVVSLMKNRLYDNAQYVSLGVYWEPNAFDLRDQEYIGKLYHDATGNFTPRIRRGANSTIVVEADNKGYLKPFYLLPKQNQKNYIGEPTTTIEQNQEKIDVSFSSTIDYRGIFYGVVRFDVDIADIIVKTQELEIFGGQSSISLISSKGKVIAQSDRPDVVNIELSDLIDSPTEISNLLNAKTYSFTQEENKITVDYPIRFKNTTSRWFVRATIPTNTFFTDSATNQWLWFTLNAIMFVMALFVVSFVISYQIKPLKQLYAIVEKLSGGQVNNDYSFKTTGTELHVLKNGLRLLDESISYNANFAKQLGNSSFNAGYTPLGPDDELGNALFAMQENLLKNKQKEKVREAKEEIRSWTNRGIAELNEVVRRTPDKIEDLTKAVLLFMIKYLKINQGGFFVYHENQNESYFELSAAYAYNKERLVEKRLDAKDGLINSCIKEEKTIYLKEVPEGYLKITSGVGEITPSFLLITPLIHGKSVLGVIELASFADLKSHEVELVEKAASAIAAEIASIKVKEHTDLLLAESRIRSEKMQLDKEKHLAKIETLEHEQQENKAALEELNTFFKAVTGSIFTTEYDLSGIVRDVNDTLLEFLGTPKEELVGKPHKHTIIDDNFSDDDYQAFWKSLREGEEVQRIFNYQINNQNFWFAEQFSPILNKQNEVIKIIKVSTDITQLKQQALQLEQQSSTLKQHEKELQENIEMLSLYKERVYNSQNQLNSILKVIEPIVNLAEFTFEGIVRSVNLSFEENYNLVKSELIGSHVRDIIHFDHKEYNSLLSSVLAGNVVTRQNKIFGNTGDKWLAEFFAPVKDNKGELIRIWYIAYDISELVNQKLHLNNRLNRLMKLANQYKEQARAVQIENHKLKKQNLEHELLSVALKRLVTVVVYSPQGKIYRVNSRLEKLTGKTQAELDGLSFNHLIKLPDLYDEELFWLDAQEEALEVETKLRLAEKEIWLSEIYYPIIEGDEVIKIVAIGTDISSIKAVENASKIDKEKILAIGHELEKHKDEVQRIKHELTDAKLFEHEYRKSFSILAAIMEFDSNGHLIYADSTSKAFYNIEQEHNLSEYHHSDFIAFSSLQEYEKAWSALRNQQTQELFFSNDEQNNEQNIKQIHLPIHKNNTLIRVLLLSTKA